jgi:Tfp pilus assembly protein PilN
MIYLRTSVGIEFRGDDMLIASLQSNVSGSVFTHFMRISNYRQRKVDDVRREVLSFFKAHGLSKENIVVGIPRRDIVLRYLDLPAEVQENLKQVVQYQVQSFEPTEEDRLYHDYALIRGNGGSRRLTVMLATVSKSILDELIQYLLALGIRPAIMTGSSMGLANLFMQSRKDRQDKTFMLADLGVSALETVALRNGSLVFSREVQKESQTSWKDLVLSEAAEAASKIRLGPEGTVEKLILAGESSESVLADIRTAVPDCELIRNSAGVDVPGENRPHVQEGAPAIGLALTGMIRRPAFRLNLLPQERRLHQSRWAYVPAAILGAAILVLCCGLAFHKTVQNRKLAQTLNAQIQSLKAPVDRILSYREQADELEKKAKSVEDLLSKKDMNLESLRELTSILPQDTFLNTYRYQDGTIQISGMSASASDLIPKLEKSPLFKDVVQRGMIYKNPQTGKEQFNFEMKLER